MPTFAALCFQPRNAQIAADIAEWFPAALWLDLELQPLLGWFLTSRRGSTKKSKRILAGAIVIVPSMMPARRNASPTPSPCVAL